MDTFTPPDNPKIQEKMHMEDEDTTWFGVAKDTANVPVLQDYGRYATLMANSATGERVRYPQLVSFIGQTGAGKSTIVKMLIEQQRGLDNATSAELFPTPIPGSVRNENVPTSGDVHLYADPATYLGPCPLLYADCEGLEGGEKSPVAIRHREIEHQVETRLTTKSDGDRKDTRKRWKMARASQRDIAWATSPETKKRQYAVTQLYPRLLYTFSDVIVFVLQNSKTFESTVLSKLLDWAHTSMEKSVNQPTLPHAIIALNATDTSVDQQLWGPDFATENLMGTVAGAISRDAKYRDYADYWKERGKVVRTMKDLLECYYASVLVVRIPRKGRYMLINEQVTKLHQEITANCNVAYNTKRKARMLSNSDELNGYLQSAFDHFSQKLDTPFNFVEVAWKNNPIPNDFGGNILKLAVAVRNAGRLTTGSRIFQELSAMVASCMVLDCVRNGHRGKHTNKLRF
ncbi:MAG: hypothetical protein M1822_009132 [Bathelium mastoideum]|nr:MAG: hypothetical protein M1822_009132 [Bathelium mastoideum]